jgi:argininosuccinate lyase
LEERRQRESGPLTQLTGRLASAPHHLLHTEILEPQFSYELEYLLAFYILIEQAQVLEYARLGLIAPATVARVGTILQQISPRELTADPRSNLSDISFAIEQFVERRLPEALPAWHVDRSRNDAQACAQLMSGRDQLLDTADDLIALARATWRVAGRYTTWVMPGYTQYQAAQVISPGFYLAALCEHLLEALRSLLAIYDTINLCPLGAGSMAGQQLPWDRHRMARLLGFRGPERHALVSVASRSWRLRIAAECSSLGLILSRFVTDLITWGSSEYNFLELPDDLAGISASMPQKKNYPILERIRGKTGHLSAFSLDMLLGQRNTPYTNLVEVSKESGQYLVSLFATTRSTLQLFTMVIEQVRFQAAAMRAACEREHMYGFTLANNLTLASAIPYRRAQVIAGKYIVAAMELHTPPQQADRALLEKLCQAEGYILTMPEEILQQTFSVDGALRGKQSSGSTSPQAMADLLTRQQDELSALHDVWAARRASVQTAFEELHRWVDAGEKGGAR